MENPLCKWQILKYSAYNHDKTELPSQEINHLDGPWGWY